MINYQKKKAEKQSGSGQIIPDDPSPPVVLAAAAVLNVAAPVFIPAEFRFKLGDSVETWPDSQPGVRGYRWIQRYRCCFVNASHWQIWRWRNLNGSHWHRWQMDLWTSLITVSLHFQLNILSMTMYGHWQMGVNTLCIGLQQLIAHLATSWTWTACRTCEHYLAKHR